jgi:hypothetical protein
MSEKLLCRCCGQPLPPAQRGGIYLPARKAEIFDFIHKHRGITAEGVAYHVGITPKCARQHIWQINEMLAATDTRIVCIRENNDPGTYWVTTGVS